MRFYKNVDICDLDNILEKGILSLDKSGNDNWDNGKRANNPTDCVYLFRPIDGKQNAFPKYGVALLEVEVEGAEKSSLADNDAHKDDYIEYVIDEVRPEQIKRVIIPEIFKERLHLSKPVENMVEWCGFSATYYDEDNGGFERKSADFGIIEQFAKTAPLNCSSDYCFFRGMTVKNHMIDFYDVKYIFN